MAALQVQLLLIASFIHKATFFLFGFFIPAFSSVKAVVHRDSEACHQWTTYWLILHLYLVILSPILNLTLHPIFQIVAILWLSLPHYQGALVVYDRMVNPWVDQYERKVDDAVEEAQQGMRRWMWSRLGGMTWVLMGEGGSLAIGIVNIVLSAINGLKNSTTLEDSLGKNATICESLGQQFPRHSVKEALRETSSIDDLGKYRFDPTNAFVNDFMSMLQQGLYVLANVDNNNEETFDVNDVMKNMSNGAAEREFKLSTFSYIGKENGAFLISRASHALHEKCTKEPAPTRLPLDSLISWHPHGSRGLILECRDQMSNASINNCTPVKRTEIILPDESDRDILLGGLNACLPHILQRAQQE